MMKLTNYIADVNKFKLAKPPAYRLRELFEFDPSIVIIPSREQSYHILAQRDRKLTLQKEIDPHIIAADEAMLRSYNLVSPLKLVSVTGGWNWSSTDLRPQLVARSVARMGGSARVIEAIEAQDEADRLKRLRYRDEDILTPRIRAGVRAFQMRRGSRILNGGTTPLNHPSQTQLEKLLARSAQRASSAPSGSTQPLVTLT